MFGRPLRARLRLQSGLVGRSGAARGGHGGRLEARSVVAALLDVRGDLLQPGLCFLDVRLLLGGALGVLHALASLLLVLGLGDDLGALALHLGGLGLVEREELLLLLLALLL